MKGKLRKILFDGIQKHFGLIEQQIPDISLEIPNQQVHGDFASNAAMVLARPLRRSPIDIARNLVDYLNESDLVDRVELAGPGFINIFVRKEAWYETLVHIARQKEHYGQQANDSTQNVLIEFVSANPTGPLHFGHGRGAVVGDVLANLLESQGHRVTREYYVNDAGLQVRNLARSVVYHLLAGHGVEIDFPADGYRGEYVKTIAEQLPKDLVEFVPNEPTEDQIQGIESFAIGCMLENIKEVLDLCGICMQKYSSERELVESGRVGQMFTELESRGVLEKRDGATWFASDRFGDEKPRVLIKSDASHTYFATDIAYHFDKIKRGYEKLINIWGADHDGYVARVKASLQALDTSPDVLEVILLQMVSLSRDGTPVVMSKRGGHVITLREVIEEVGRDATRFFFLMRKPDSQMEFDLELAKRKSMDNPVYYVQYGHARLTSILAKASDNQLEVPLLSDAPRIDLSLLDLPEELGIIKKMNAFEDIVQSATQKRSPHLIVYYLNELVASFHSYYTQYSRTNPILGSEPNTLAARLILVQALRQVIRNALTLLGVSAPDRMESPSESDDDV